MTVTRRFDTLSKPSYPVSPIDTLMSGIVIGSDHFTSQPSIHEARMRLFGGA